jgi:hypothetical protein
MTVLLWAAPIIMAIGLYLILRYTKDPGADDHRRMPEEP